MSWPHATIWTNGLYGPDGPITGVDVSVFQAGTSNRAVLYADEAKTVPLRNPLPKNVAEDGWGLDVNGNLKFAVDADDYRLVWTDQSGDHNHTFAVPNHPADVAAAAAGQGSPGPAPWNPPVPYNPAATYAGATSVTPADSVYFSGSLYIAIVPSVTGVAPDSDATKWALAVSGSDVATAISQALAAQGQVLSPHNALLGLAGSTFDPALSSTSTFTVLAAGQFQWAGLVLQTGSVSAINVLVTTAQIGSGSQVGLYAQDGTLLQSQSTGVDTWLGTIGSRDLTLTTPLTSADVSIGQIVYVGISQPASGVTTPAQLRQTTAPATAVNAHQLVGVRTGTAAGTTPPSAIPFLTATATTLPYVGLVP